MAVGFQRPGTFPTDAIVVVSWWRPSSHPAETIPSNNEAIAVGRNVASPTHTGIT